MTIEFLKARQSGNIFDVGLIRESFDPALPVPEGVWIDIQKLNATSLNNGVYLVMGAVLYNADSTVQQNRFRLLEFGEPQAEIAAELKDTDDLIYTPFFSWLNVTENYIDIAIQGQQEEGGGEPSLQVFSSAIWYWKISDQFTEIIEQNPFIDRAEQMELLQALTTGKPKKSKK